MIHEDENIRINNIQSRAIVIKENKALVMWRNKNDSIYYVFPGGHMDIGEKPIDTAAREVFEETTIKAKDLELVYETKDYANSSNEQTVYLFIGKWDSGEPTLSGEESRRANQQNQYKPMWIDLKDIPSLNLYSLPIKEWVINNMERISNI